MSDEEEWEEVNDQDLAIAHYGLEVAHHYLVDTPTLLAAAKLEPDWLVRGVIPKKAVTFFVGKPGEKKSWHAYDLVCAVVQQRPWLGFGSPEARPNPTALVLNFDQPSSECGRRFRRLGLRPSDSVFFHSIDAHRPPPPLPHILQLPGAFEQLEALVYAFLPDVIVVDSLRQSHTSDESNSQEMALVISCLRRLAVTGSAVIVVHHTRKNDDMMRGSTEIEAGADGIVTVTGGIATWYKTRGWVMPDPSVAFWLEDDGDETFLRGGQSLSKLLQGSGPLTQQQISEQLQISNALTKDLVARGVANGIVETVKSGTGGNVIKLRDEWKRAHVPVSETK